MDRSRRRKDHLMGPFLYHEGGFPPEEIHWGRLLPVIGPTHAALSRFAGVLYGIPDPDILLAPLISQEAVLSSRIEGTQATLGEVLAFEAAEETASPENHDDIRELRPAAGKRAAVLFFPELLEITEQP